MGGRRQSDAIGGRPSECSSVRVRSGARTYNNRKQMEYIYLWRDRIPERFAERRIRAAETSTEGTVPGAWMTRKDGIEPPDLSWLRTWPEEAGAHPHSTSETWPKSPAGEPEGTPETSPERDSSARTRPRPAASETATVAPATLPASAEDIGSEAELSTNASRHAMAGMTDRRLI